MNNNEILNYERKPQDGKFEKRFAMVGGWHQELKMDVMAEINLRIPDNQFVIRYSTNNSEGKKRYVVAESDPSDARVRWFQGVAYYQMGDFSKSLRKFEEAIKINPNYKDSTENYIREIYNLAEKEDGADSLQ